jgi:citrate lyase subunit beta/citryl-CoA lyase
MTPQTTPIRVRRSVLITPGDDEHLLRRACESAADVNVIEWEDGVYESRKQAARDLTAAAFAELDWSGHEKVVRINPATTPWWYDDIDAAVRGGADAILLAKSRGAADIKNAADVIGDAERHSGRDEGSVLIWTMIETVDSLVHADAIATASPRVTALFFGGGDLGADLHLKQTQLGAQRTLGPIRYEYIYGYGRVVAASRNAGVDPINMGYTTYTDLEGTKRDAEFSAQFGFTGGLALSPRQLDVINAAFSPSESDVAWARDVLGTFGTANTNDRTVIVVDGEMADGPYVRAAQRILALHEAIVAKDTAQATRTAATTGAAV